MRRRTSTARQLRLLAVVCAGAGAGAGALALAGSPSALAHGDPASHYLEAESLYPAFASRPTPALELRLLGLLEAAAARGYPIKVALVANAQDLTVDASMLERPQFYAESVELLLGGPKLLSAPIVVVTPYGIGVAGRERSGGVLRSVDARDARGLAGGVRVSRRAQGDGLARAAIALVRQIARAGGRPLPANVPPAAAIRSRSSTSAAGSSAGLPHVPAPLLAIAAAFVLSLLAYETWVRLARRGELG